MKKLLSIFLFLVLFIPVLLYADDREGSIGSSRELALQAFNTSEAVQNLLWNAVGEGKEVSKRIDIALLSATSGAKGVSRTYLVTQGTTTRGVNPQTDVVAAVVIVGPVGYTSVRVVNISVLFPSEPRPRRAN